MSQDDIEARQAPEVPLAVGQVRENPYNGQRCIIREVINETHAVVDWFGWPHSSGKQDVGYTTFIRMAEDQPRG